MTNYPAHWKTMMLEEVSAVIDPHPSHRAPAIDPKGIPFVGIGDVREDGIADFRGARLVSPKILSEHSERYSLESDLIGLGRVASVGKVVKLPKGDTPYTISPTLAVISPNEISFDFLYYVLQSPQIQNQLIGLKQGSGRQSVGILKLRKVVVPFPPVDEQHKIVGILEDHLSRLDTALSDVKQAKVKAAQFRRSLLQAAFTGNLSGDGTRLITELPEEWYLSIIGDLCGQVEKMDPANLDRDTFRYVDIGSLEPSSSSLENVEPISSTNAPSRARQLIREGDSVFSTVRPYMKKVAYIPREFDGEIASTGFCVLRPKIEKLNPKFLFYFLLSDRLLDQVLPLQRGVSYPAIRDNDLKSALIPLPPLPEQQKIVEILEDHLSRLDASIAIADTMEKQSSSLRRSLLQAAFTGQLAKEVASV